MRDIEELRLVPSAGGRYEITVDGRKVWSKVETKTFPTYEQVLEGLGASPR